MYLLLKFFLWSICLTGLWWKNCGRMWRNHTFLTLCSKFQFLLLEKYMKCRMKTEDLSIFTLLRMISLCQIKSMKEQDKETLSICTNTFQNSELCLVFEKKAFCKFPVIQTIVQALAKSEHSWIYLGFSQNLAVRLLDCMMIWHLCVTHAFGLIIFAHVSNQISLNYCWTRKSWALRY